MSRYSHSSIEVIYLPPRPPKNSGWPCGRARRDFEPTGRWKLVRTDSSDEWTIWVELIFFNEKFGHDDKIKYVHEDCIVFKETLHYE